MAATELRTTVVIDYQNVHLVGHAAFDERLPKHETLVDPALYAGQLLAERNRRQRPGHPPAVLQKVLVTAASPLLSTTQRTTRATRARSRIGSATGASRSPCVP